MNVGEYIKTLRMQKGMTQEELGEKIGVKRAAVQKWECGSVQNLKRSTIKKLSEIFQVSPSSFISVHSESIFNNLTSSEQPILSKYNRLNSIGKQKAETYIDDLLENPKYTTSYKIEAERKAAAKSLHDRMDIAAFGGGVKCGKKKDIKTT